MCSFMIKGFAFALVVVAGLASAKTTAKRGVQELSFYHPLPQELAYGFQPAEPWVGASPIDFTKTSFIPQGLTFHKPLTYHPIHPIEIATAVSAAKEATARVLRAQHRVQEAKDAVLEQQHISRAKETAAALALQRSEAAAAVQRQAASAAASEVVHAQQRLAEAKAEVAREQRIAAEKEQAAASAIQRSASAAAAEIRRTEDTAAKIAALQRNEANAAIQHVTAAKDASLAATAAAVAASANIQHVHQVPQHYLQPKKLQLQEYPWN